MPGKDIDEIGDLKQKLAECELLRDEYLDGWQRSKADYANFKKEIRERDLESRDRLKARLVEDLVPVLESMDQARAWIKDLAPIEAQFEKVLRDFGLKVISEEGVKFDPQIHESVELVPVAEANKDNIIMELVARGYALSGKVVKPAKVKVGSFKEN
jgi:molecular chaperone GrpE